MISAEYGCIMCWLMQIGGGNMSCEKITQTDESLILVNIVEELVKNKVDSAIKSLNMCSCKKCRLNACAIALNALPARYVTTTKGTLLALLATNSLEYQTSVQVEVIKALNVVKEYPMHCLT